MIELAILGLLTEQDLHGYELKKQLGELLGSWSTMSFGSLYPALARLEKTGLVKAVETAGADEPAIPMTGALSGELAAFRHRIAAKTGKQVGARGRRGKKVYGITGLGRDRFHELVTAPGPDDERTFALRVAFCRQLHPAERLVLFEQRKAELNSQLASRRRPAAAPSGRGDVYRRSLRDRDTRTLTNDLEWLDELIVATRDQAEATGSARADRPIAFATADVPRFPVAGPMPDLPPSTPPPSPDVSPVNTAKAGSNP